MPCPQAATWPSPIPPAMSTPARSPRPTSASTSGWAAPRPRCAATRRSPGSSTAWSWWRRGWCSCTAGGLILVPRAWSSTCPPTPGWDESRRTAGGPMQLMPQNKDLQVHDAVIAVREGEQTGQQADDQPEQEEHRWMCGTPAHGTNPIFRAPQVSAIIRRVRSATGAIPVISAYDRRECVWLAPSPWLFQRRLGTEHRRICEGAIRNMLNAALVHTGLTDPATGNPLHFTPHDFRRIFITDAILNGLPPHIAQVIAGHHDINVTLGYKAVYPEEAIQAHRAFLAHRRALRPSEEYRTPTDEEWTEFLGHFERRKVSIGTCARAFATPCIHEHACVRCPMLWPDPTQRDRLVEIRDNLIDRIAEAEREGWLGEVEGLQVSLAGAQDKLAQLDRRNASRTTVDLGIPTVARKPS